MENVITVVNNVKIIELENSLFPVKPICDALGIDFDSQRKKINSTEKLSSVAVLSTATGADGKRYEMLCLPIKKLIVWLLSINPKNVKEEMQESVNVFQEQCYDAIFDSLFLNKIFLKEKEKHVEEKLKEIEFHKANFHEAQTRLKQSEKDLKELRQFTFEDWKLKQAQTSMVEIEGFEN